MADTFTTNYSWTKPSIGGDSTTWGNDLNADLDSIDSTVFAVSTVANAALPRASFTDATVLAMVLAVDGPGSNLNADLLDSQQGSFYQNASNINTGTLPVGQLPATAFRYSNSFQSASVTVSSSAPSGGQSGDIWIQI